MNAAVLTLSLWLASPICYHAGIFYPGGSDAVCMDEVTMRWGKPVVLSAVLAGAAAGVVSQMPDAKRGGPEPDVPKKVRQVPVRPTPKYATRVSADPQDAQGWSKLADVYLTRAQKTDNPRDFLRAYEASVQALEEDDRLLEALFTKAEALEGLSLFDAARPVWQELEQTPSWAALANRKLKDLDQSETVGTRSEQEEAVRKTALQGNADQVKAIVDQYRKVAREYAEQKLFGNWGEAWLKGETQAAEEHLSVLQAVGDALAETNGERLVQDSVARINELLRNGDMRGLSDLARGAREFRDGYKLYSVRHSSSAVPQLTIAYEALRQAGCALAWRAAFYLASADYVSRKYPEALAGTERLAKHIENLPYRALRAHVYWIKGMAGATLGRTHEAIKDLKNAFADFAYLGESENAANIDCRLGEVLMARGRKSEAWEVIYRALRSTPTLRDSDQIAAVYMIAGNAALQDGFEDAALVFQEERVRQSRLNKDNILALVEALTWLARFQHHQGDDAGAQDSLQEARRLINNEKMDPKQRPRRLADLAMIQGMILEEEDPYRAAEFLSAALPTYQSENNAIFSLWTRLARGRAYRESGKDDAAEKDFEAAMKRYEEMGEPLEAEDFRLALLEETDSVFDEMVGLQADQGNWERALAYADRARTRVLPGSASKLWTGLEEETTLLLASEPQPLPLNEIRRRLPQGVTLVQFSVLRDRVLIWTLRRSGEGERPLSQKIQREDLEDLVAWFRDIDSKDWGKASEELFDLLIRPWLSTVSAEERIVFIPDKVLHWVTFSALKDSRSGNYLIETHPVAIAPSATLYVNALERQDVKPPRGRRGLVVGEPEIDHSVPGNEVLSSLPWAQDEAEELAEQTGAQKLVGEKATETAFRLRAPQAEWIQFSGHAVIDPANTLLSKLVLAPGDNSDEDNGALTAQEIYSQKLKDTQLVFLAACDTGNEYVPGGEGVTSLARAFLAAGVPTVVASLWSVDDKATARLSEIFHRYYQKSGDPVEALRQAQLQMLHGKDEKYRSPSSWAAFEVIGASADDQP